MVQIQHKGDTERIPEFFRFKSHMVQIQLIFMLRCVVSMYSLNPTWFRYNGKLFEKD